MASITSLGIGSNLDLASLLDQLKTAESQPLIALQKRQISYTAKLSAYGTVQSSLANLQAVAKKLSDAAFFQGAKTSSGTPEVLTASAGTAAAPGTYAVNVTQLAQAQSLVSAGRVDAKAAVGSGTLRIEFGTIDGGAYDAAAGKYTGAGFTVDAERSAVDITIDNKSNTLEGIRDAINKAKAGVTASIVNDGSGTPFRLVLTSTETGKASSMKVSVTGDAALSSLLDHDPAGTQGLQQTVAAANAELTVNGIAVRSPTNTVKEAIQGVTLTVLKTGTSNVATQRDTATVETAINDFVKAYNSLQSTAKGLTAYNTETKSGGALVGDTTLRNLQVGIRSALITPQTEAAGPFTVLSSIGVSFQKDGTLAVDAAKLKAALAGDLEGVSKLFASAPGGTTGYGKQIDRFIEGLSATDGALKTAKDGISTSLKELDKQYAAMQERVDAKVARYRAQFGQLDLLVSSMNRTSGYLTQQFESLNRSTK